MSAVTSMLTTTETMEKTTTNANALCRFEDR
jgi:hypothetical protein